MLNLYNLKYFYDACRLTSMAGAAEINFVSRPAISQGIKKLEEQVGVPLLEHRQRKLKPTPQGLLLMQKAAEIFLQVENASTLLKSPESALSGYLVVGTARTLATFKLDCVISHLKEKYPNLKIKIEIQVSSELVRLLADRQIDVALFLGDERLPNCEQVVIKKGRFKLIRPRKLKGRELAYAITEKRPETNRLKTLFERKFKQPLPIFGEIPSWDAILNWVDNGTCGGLVPDFLLPHTTNPHLVVLDDVHPYEIKAMYHNSRAQDRSVQEFISTVRERIV
jgi:DNA-binding transcriptional LysR family regulator